MNDVGMYQLFTFKSPINTWDYLSQGMYSDSTLKNSIDPTSTISSNTIYYLKLTLKNTSGEIWQKSTFALGTNNPPDRTSSFYNSSWQSPNRAATLKEDTVLPGGTGTFEFAVKTPSSAADYKEYFRPVVEGKVWLVDLGLYWQLKVR